MKKISVQNQCIFSAILLLLASGAFPLDYTKAGSGLADAFYNTAGANEGTTSFRSLLIPSGGRAESLGSAYTALSDDISFLDYNPAASSLLNETEVALFHNAWIADSAKETLAATTRFGNLGIGGKLSCFYVPFTEYDRFGQRASANYYSETALTLNTAYNFLAGYTFKGIAVGGNVKTAWRAVPDYADDNTGAVLSNSGLRQSALAFMADAGILLQFNAAKFYDSHDGNLKIGLSVTNLGAAMTGFSKEIKLDDPLPTSAGIGISYKPVNPFMISLEFRQPVNLFNITELQAFTAGGGAEVKITKFMSILAGFQLKGGNPRISLGSEFELLKIRMNINYTLDLASSINPVNRLSFSAKIRLGDKGRAEKRRQIEDLYAEGLAYYAARDFDKAVAVWEDVLKLDKYFDPAKDGIKSVKRYFAMLEGLEGTGRDWKGLEMKQSPPASPSDSQRSLPYSTLYR
ncbi:MAG: UPF0164 family protein [Treponema sp.]